MFFQLRAPTSKTTEAVVLNYEGVYYIEDGYLYMGRSWDEPMYRLEITLPEADESIYNRTFVLHGDLMELFGGNAGYLERNAAIDVSGVVFKKIITDEEGNRVN